MPGRESGPGFFVFDARSMVARWGNHVHQWRGRRAVESSGDMCPRISLELLHLRFTEGDVGPMTDAHLKAVDAWRAMQAGNFKEAARLYEPLAEQGSETALINLGTMYERGRLGRPDEKRAVSLWKRAASAGSAAAKYRLGDCSRAKAISQARASGSSRAHSKTTSHPCTWEARC